MRFHKLLSRYGVMGSIGLFLDWIYTKVFYPKCRLIRRSIRVRSDKPVVMGVSMTCGIDLRLDCFDAGVVHFGKNIQINDYVHIASIQHVSIGDNTLIASRVFISDHNHGQFDKACAADAPDMSPAIRPLSSKPVHIGKNVWIGESVCVLPGVSIGDGAVVGAGSVVTRSVPAECVVAGNPARVLRRFNRQTKEWEKS